MNEHVMEHLSDYLDDELDPVTTRAVARHLAGCQDCSATLNQLKTVKNWAPGFTGLPTAHDLWPGVKGEIEKPGRTALPWHGRRVTIGMPLLLAASVVLLLLSGAVVTLLRRGPGSNHVVATQTVRPGWNFEKAGLTDQQYDTAITQLEQLLATSDSVLEPGTLQVIRQSLTKIDKAIDDARLAIARDSNNAFLRASIAANQRRKLALLRTAAQAVTAKS